MDKNEDAPEPSRLKSVGEWAKLADYNTMQEQEMPETPSARQQALNDLEETIAELIEAEGETPSALSARDAYYPWRDKRTAWEASQSVNEAIAFADYYAADLRSKLSTAERDYKTLLKGAGIVEKELKAAEAELARVREAHDRMHNHNQNVICELCEALVNR